MMLGHIRQCAHTALTYESETVDHCKFRIVYPLAQKGFVKQVATVAIGETIFKNSESAIEGPGLSLKHSGFQR